MRIGRALSAILAPGYSWCGKCGTAWKFVEGHVVDYDFEDVPMPDGTIVRDFPRMGHFALCEECWEETTEDERVEAHLKAMGRWSEADEIAAAKIVAAVRKESS